MTMQLDYAGAVMARPMRGLMWSAIVLAGLPLVVGLVTLLLYMATDWEWLVGMGMLTLVGGPIMVLVSLGLMIGYAAHAWRSKCVTRKLLVRQSLGVLGLILLNFPAAAVCVQLGGNRATAPRVQVTVRNQMQETVQVKLIGPLSTHRLSIPGGQTRIATVRARQGNLTYRVLIGQQVNEGEARSWPDDDAPFGDTVTMTISSGSVTVK